MERFSFDITIIGAGIVGLAIVDNLSRRPYSVLLVEKNDSYGRETSSRNSEVIHAGIHYPPDFLKARFCRQGNALLYNLCAEQEIPHRRLGKIIVACHSDKTEGLWRLKKQAEQNGVFDLVFLSRSDMHSLEPLVKAEEALFSPSTGIIDSHRLMTFFYTHSLASSATVAFRAEATAIRRDGCGYDLEINHGEYRVMTKVLINSAGLHADHIASLAGIDAGKEGYTLNYCKGDYFFTSPAPSIHHLIYPVPATDKEGLGIHATMDMGERIRFGPDVEYVPKLDYRIREEKREVFHQAIRRYLPSVTLNSLQPDMSGIRPKLQKPGEPYRDFIIREESALGYPGFINLIGIESPGLTGCIPIAESVHSLVAMCL
jgi:L-2-hydroxyglutarate oxidase LhgO